MKLFSSITFWSVLLMVGWSCSNSSESTSDVQETANAQKAKADSARIAQDRKSRQLLSGVTWKAEWNTPSDAPSYANIEDMEFYMDGMFAFEGDSLTVQNNGYPGCIFAVDTLQHTQLWDVSHGSLITYNDPSNPGMTYTIKSISEDRIELQLMEDIFVTLSK